MLGNKFVKAILIGGTVGLILSLVLTLGYVKSKFSVESVSDVGYVYKYVNSLPFIAMDSKIAESIIDETYIFDGFVANIKLSGDVDSLNFLSDTKVSVNNSLEYSFSLTSKEDFEEKVVITQSCTADISRIFYRSEEKVGFIFYKWDLGFAPEDTKVDGTEECLSVLDFVNAILILGEELDKEEVPLQRVPMVPLRKI